MKKHKAKFYIGLLIIIFTLLNIILFSQSIKQTHFFELVLDKELYKTIPFTKIKQLNDENEVYELKHRMPDISKYEKLKYNDVAWATSLVLSYLEKHHKAVTSETDGYSDYSLCSPEYLYRYISQGQHKNTIYKAIKHMESNGCISIGEQKSKHNTYKRFQLEENKTRRLTRVENFSSEDIELAINSIKGSLRYYDTPVIAGCRAFNNIESIIRSNEIIDLDTEQLNLLNKAHTMVIIRSEIYKGKNSFKILSPLKDKPFWITHNTFKKIMVEAYKVELQTTDKLVIDFGYYPENAEDKNNITIYHKDKDKNYLYIKEKILKKVNENSGDRFKFTLWLTQESSHVYMLYIGTDNKIKSIVPKNSKNDIIRMRGSSIHYPKYHIGNIDKPGVERFVFILSGKNKIDEIFSIVGKNITIETNSTTSKIKNKLKQYFDEKTEMDVYVFEFESVREK